MNLEDFSSYFPTESHDSRVAGWTAYLVRLRSIRPDISSNLARRKEVEDEFGGFFFLFPIELHGGGVPDWAAFLVRLLTIHSEHLSGGKSERICRFLAFFERVDARMGT